MCPVRARTYPRHAAVQGKKIGTLSQSTRLRSSAEIALGSCPRYPNMKELRFAVGRQAWRVAYAFDPERKGILLVAGNKQGVNEKQFYERLIRVADDRFDRHLGRLKR
jgi:hypothetical protein